MGEHQEYAIIGLGNPGSQYCVTRHNVGFLFLDFVAERCGVAFQASRWDADVVRGMIHGQRAFLFKPKTFMNLSGKAVAAFARYYGIGAEQLIVVHDDIDMALGRVKVVRGGGAGGHKGIRSIVTHLGTADFIRVKIGVGRPGQGGTHVSMPVDAYVLAPFSAEEMIVIRERFDRVEQCLDLLLSGDMNQAMTALNRIK